MASFENLFILNTANNDSITLYLWEYIANFIVTKSRSVHFGLGL